MFMYPVFFNSVYINKITKQYYVIYTISSLNELGNTCEISVLK